MSSNSTSKPRVLIIMTNEKPSAPTYIRNTVISYLSSNKLLQSHESRSYAQIIALHSMDTAENIKERDMDFAKDFAGTLSKEMSLAESRGSYLISKWFGSAVKDVAKQILAEHVKDHDLEQDVYVMDSSQVPELVDHMVQYHLGNTGRPPLTIFTEEQLETLKTEMRPYAIQRSAFSSKAQMTVSSLQDLV